MTLAGSPSCTTLRREAVLSHPSFVFLCRGPSSSLVYASFELQPGRHTTTLSHTRSHTHNSQRTPSPRQIQNNVRFAVRLFSRMSSSCIVSPSSSTFHIFVFHLRCSIDTGFELTYCIHHTSLCSSSSHSHSLSLIHPSINVVCYSCSLLPYTFYFFHSISMMSFHDSPS